MKFSLKIKSILVLFVGFLVIFLFFLLTFIKIIFLPPKDFPYNYHIHVDKGKNLAEIAAQLKDEKIIRSSTFFIILTKINGKEMRIMPGDYFFKEPVDVLKIINRLSSSDFLSKSVKITIPEGMTAIDIAEIFRNFDNFDTDRFMNLVEDQKLEGYLFPDTYLFLDSMTEKDVIENMKNNFDSKLSGFFEEVGKSGRNLSDIINMASIIEKEISNSDNRKIVSGILWKRLDKGMPLQVDAVFYYIDGEKNSKVNYDDLKTDSLYNTYLYKGLPPTPICNPGLDAIRAALEPEDSLYWYYLSGKDGNTYFAKTFEEHKINRDRYLK